MRIGDLDIINPLDGLIGRALHGPMHRFTFDADSPFSGTEIEQLLRHYGIRVWGREMKTEGERGLLVRRSQAVWAEYVLCRAGVPLTGPLLDPRNLQYKNNHPQNSMPDPWNEKGIGASSFVDHVVDWIDRLF